MNINYIKTNNTIEAVKLINKIRLNNSNKWYYIQITCNGVTYDIKAFNTWLQIFTNGKASYSNCMDETIKQYKEHLFKVLN
jgi:hypothetical protein